MMTCEELLDFITAWREGSLPKDVKEVFDQHLAVCPCCEAYLGNYLKAEDLARHLGKCRDESEPCPEPLVQAILSARRKTTKGPTPEL